MANVIFLESPAGVGFSSFTDAADNTVGDERTAADAYDFLLGFLSLYPQFADRDFYIAGESYAGANCDLLPLCVESSVVAMSSRRFSISRGSECMLGMPE